MTIELTIPEVGESIHEVDIGQWLKAVGDPVKEDEDLVELETDKATVDLPAPAAGVLKEIIKSQGESVKIGDVIGYLDESTTGKPAAKAVSGEKEQASNQAAHPDSPPQDQERDVEAEAEPETEAKAETEEPRRSDEAPADVRASANARRLLERYGVDPAKVQPTGEHGQLLAADVQRFVQQQQSETGAEFAAEVEAPESGSSDAIPAAPPAANLEAEEYERTVPFSSLRRKIAERLVRAQHEAALLTTVNEIDMSAVQALRTEHGEHFQAEHGVRLGLMSFFVKAAVDALRKFPIVNATIRGRSIVYRDAYHVGIAVATDEGLVVPVLRHADQMSFAEMEQDIADFADRARSGRLKPGELQGGTFTISNGGVYGSLLSTPIVNPPQSGILGMHAIQDRPVARAGQVVIRPMMYVALTYDHRLIDGREAVLFLKWVKQLVEAPFQLLLT